MSDENERSVASAGFVQRDSLSAYLAWRDGKIASGDSDVNPFMVWSAGVRYATLTDAERDVLGWLVCAADDSRYANKVVSPAMRATLRGLLERTRATDGMNRATGEK